MSDDARTRLAVHVKPRAKKSRVVALADGPDGAVEISLAAPPVDGAANDELVRFLAEALDVPKRSLEILRGHASRHKLVAIATLTKDQVADRLRQILGAGA